MAFEKKEQFENKLNDVKLKFKNKKNLATILEHDSELKMKSHSFSGRLQYLTILLKLNEFYEKDFKKFTAKDLKHFFSELKPWGVYNGKKKELSAKSRWIYMCLIKSFFKWLYDAEDDNAPDVVKWIKRSKYVGHNRKLLPSEIPDSADILKMVDAAKFTRDKAFIFALFESGCRINSEFLQVKIGELNVNERYACFDVKGDVKTHYSERTCYLIRSWPKVREWLEVHPSKNDPNAPLWISIRGKTFGGILSDDGASHIVERASKDAKLKKRVWPHLLRHARALECAKQGYSAQVMNKMFGWSDSSDMSNWYVSLSTSDVRDVVLEKSGVVPPKSKSSSKMLDLAKCPRCSKEWSAGTKFCTCGAVLNLEAAMELDEHMKKDDTTVKAMMERMMKMQSSMQDMFDEVNQLRGEKMLTEVKK